MPYAILNFGWSICKSIRSVPPQLGEADEVSASITGKKNYAPITWQEPKHEKGRGHQDNNPVDVEESGRRPSGAAS